MNANFWITISLLIPLTAIAANASAKTGHQSESTATRKTKPVVATPSATSIADSPTLKAMQARYKDASTLTAEFTQSQKNVTLGSTKDSAGTIAIKRPDKFRWQTMEPEPSILVGNGKKVWYYTPPFRDGEHGQVIVKPAADVQSKLAIDLLDGHANLKKDFKIKRISEHSFDLTPLKPAGDVERIELHIEKSTNLVYKLVLFTTTGNQTALTLKNVVLGNSLPDTMFNFVPPEGTEEVR